MYTKKSIVLKSDFYARFGEANGIIHFERTGLPCAMLDSGSCALAFSMGCGVRAYGRQYGDVLKVINDDENICDVHFVENGKGAQILYSADLNGVKGMKQTAMYTINKLLCKIGSTGRIKDEFGMTALCDKYAPEGWCALKMYDEVKSLPLPMGLYNVILIQVGRIGFSCGEDEVMQFTSCERSRIEAAAAGLRACRTDVLFEMINESNQSINRILRPRGGVDKLSDIVLRVDGVKACRVCEIGIICFCERDKTDAVIHTLKRDGRASDGELSRICVVK